MLASTSDFQTFGPPHLWAMALTVAVPVSLIVLCRKARSPTLTRWVRWTLAAVLIGNEIGYYGYKLALYGPSELVRETLPLHICGVGLYLTAWVLIHPNQLAYETAYFWGLAGTFQAIITPSVTQEFPHVRFFQFFLCHSGIVAGVLVATFVMRMRPRKGSVLRTFLLTNALMVVVALADWALGANYMFLCAPPAGESFFFFLPHPWYILFLEPVGLGLLLILYWPFWLADRRKTHGLESVGFGARR